MKINFFTFVVVHFFVIFFSTNTYSYQILVSEKYDEIFSIKILSDDDVKNYRKAYMFQDECKWKSANKYILN